MLHYRNKESYPGDLFLISIIQRKQNEHIATQYKTGIKIHNNCLSVYNFFTIKFIGINQKQEKDRQVYDQKLQSKISYITEQILWLFSLNFLFSTCT